MSYDCCRKCGKRADEPYVAVTVECDDATCPQKLRRKQAEEIFAQLPVYQRKPFAEIESERIALETALNEATSKKAG